MWLAVRWFRPRRGTEWQNQAPRLGWRASTTSSIIGPRRRIRFDRFGTAAPRARCAPHEPEPEARLDGHQRSASDPPLNRSESPLRARRGSARSPLRGRAVEYARGCRPERTRRERRRLNATSAAPPFRAGRRSGIGTLPWMGRRCAVKPAGLRHHGPRRAGIRTGCGAPALHSRIGLLRGAFAVPSRSDCSRFDVGVDAPKAKAR